MTDKEFFIFTLKDELPRFERVFKAVEETPAKKHSYKHDKKSRTTLELLQHTFGAESGMFLAILKDKKIDFMTWPKPKWKTASAVRLEFMKNMNQVLEMVKKVNEKSWEGKAGMYSGDKLEWETPLGKMLWGFLLDLIHHRGQLSTHLRPMGGKVPSSYGPSADVNG